MLPRLGSIRGDSRGQEGTSVWLERDDRQRLIARSPCHHQLRKSRGSGSTPCASTIAKQSNRAPGLRSPGRFPQLPAR